MQDIVPKSGSLLTRLMGFFGDHQHRLSLEKSRLEAFLAAFPGEYCGWAKDGSVAYSQGFCRILSLSHIRHITDIQGQLTPADAAALESFYERLNAQGTPFVIIVESLDHQKKFKLSGSQGRDLSGRDVYTVLWIEDVTAETRAQDSFAEENGSKDTEISRLQMILDHIPRPVWLRDSNQIITWCNATYCDFLGKDKKAVLEEQKEIFGPLRKKKNEYESHEEPGPPLARKAVSSGKPAETRIHNTVKGQRMLLHITEIPLKENQMTVGVAYNVTREEELQTTMKRYQASNHELMEQLHSAIAIFAVDHSLEFYNSSFSQLWDLEDQWLNSKPKLGDIMEKLRETRRLPEQADFRHFKKSWLDMFTSLLDPHEDMLYLPDGRALRMLAIPHSMGGLMITFEDVTSRLELESSYNTLIAVQKETLDNLAEAVAVFGGDGRLKLWNPSYARLWDLNPEDLNSEPHISKLVEKKRLFFEPEEWEDRKAELVAKGLDRILHEGRISRNDDTLLDFSTVPLPDGGVLVTYSDVTDNVRVENALREKNKALEAAERLKMDFLANVSYQLRTPLNAIMGFNEILDQEYFGPLNERQKQYTGDMREASERLLALINDILDLSTLEAGYLTLQREEVKIYNMMQNVFDLVTDWARKENIHVSLRCPKNIGTLLADERRLQQAIINLVRNAIAFTEDGGRIELSARRSKDGLKIQVKDNGIGIEAEDRLRIFEPFERAHGRLDENRMPKSGAGLGLSLVKNIVALHGGYVELESEPGEGTCVTLTLPQTATATNLKFPLGYKKNKKTDEAETA